MDVSSRAILLLNIDFLGQINAREGTEGADISVSSLSIKIKSPQEKKV